MPQTLLEQFLAEECTPHVRKLLEDALANPGAAASHFEFNRFGVTLGRSPASVVLEDVLDASEAGVQQVSLEEFTAALSRRSAS